MIIKNATYDVVCDMPGCDEKATYALCNDGQSVEGNFYICKKCLQELYKQIGKHLTPKSPVNIIKKNTTAKIFKN